MTLRRPGWFAAIIVTLIALPLADAQAACSDKKIIAMAGDGRSVKAIAKSCNMPVAKVRNVVDDEAPPIQAQSQYPGKSQSQGQTQGQTQALAPAQSQAQGKTKPKPSAEAEVPKGLPSGAGLARCDCKGSVPYGNKEPELRCQSGVSLATPCPGYCSPHGIAPWRRICG
jgi:hypothetical protein